MFVMSTGEYFFRPDGRVWGFFHGLYAFIGAIFFLRNFLPNVNVTQTRHMHGDTKPDMDAELIYFFELLHRWMLMIASFPARRHILQAYFSSKHFLAASRTCGCHFYPALFTFNQIYQIHVECSLSRILAAKNIRCENKRWAKTKKSLPK